MKLADLIAEPSRIKAVEPEAIPQLRGQLAELDTLLLSRLLAGKEPDAPEDQLLDVAEAARRLCVSESYLEHNHKRLPFTRRVGRKLLFSARGLAKYVSSKTTRGGG